MEFDMFKDLLNLSKCDIERPESGCRPVLGRNTEVDDRTAWDFNGNGDGTFAKGNGQDLSYFSTGNRLYNVQNGRDQNGAAQFGTVQNKPVQNGCSTIENSTVLNGRFQYGTVQNSRFPNGTVQNSKFPNATIKNGAIQNWTVRGDKVQNGTLNGEFDRHGSACCLEDPLLEHHDDAHYDNIFKMDATRFDRSTSLLSGDTSPFSNISTIDYLSDKEKDSDGPHCQSPETIHWSSCEEPAKDIYGMNTKPKSTSWLHKEVGRVHKMKEQHEEIVGNVHHMNGKVENMHVMHGIGSTCFYKINKSDYDSIEQVSPLFAHSTNALHFDEGMYQNRSAPSTESNGVNLPNMMKVLALNGANGNNNQVPYSMAQMLSLDPSNTYKAENNVFYRNAKSLEIIKHCVFCKRNGETREFYSTHIVKDLKGKVICPVLRNYVCPICKATGDSAHTLRHCPFRLKTPLQSD